MIKNWKYIIALLFNYYTLLDHLTADVVMHDASNQKDIQGEALFQMTETMCNIRRRASST